MANAYANQQPSLGRNTFEGSETRINNLEQIMKSVSESSDRWNALLYSNVDEDIVQPTRKLVD